MNYQTPATELTRTDIAGRALAREHYADWLFDRVTHTQKRSPLIPTLASPAVTVRFLDAWNGVGGFLLVAPSASDHDKLHALQVELRGFRNPNVATRARRIPYKKLLAHDVLPKADHVSPLFINSAHFPEQRHLRAIRDKVFNDATKLINAAFLYAHDEVMGKSYALSPEQTHALFLYREVDGNFTAGINNGLTLREELFHTMQSLLNVSRSYMSNEMRNDPELSAFTASVLSQSQSERIQDRNAGTETPYARMERRLGYLLSDRELQARIDKVCVEFGRVPEPYENPVTFLETLGVATGGLNDLRSHSGSIWERSIINRKPSRALAELNFAIVAAFPNGISDHFRNVALPYHMAQVVRVNSFDSTYVVAKQYGFERTKAYKPVKDAAPKLLRGLAKANVG